MASFVGILATRALCRPIQLMSKKSPRNYRSGCPISTALDLIGDPWSLLIVRDMLLKKLSTFNEFSAAGEGIASNILADRLQRLEACGVVSKHPDPHDRRRQLYRLTEKGFGLAPVLMELIIWAARHESTEAREPVVREMRLRRGQVLAKWRREWRAGAAPPSGAATAPHRTRRM